MSRGDLLRLCLCKIRLSALWVSALWLSVRRWARLVPLWGFYYWLC